MALNPVQRPSEWHPPAALGIPPSLRDHVSTLSGAYVNSGRMASGVAQLNSATAMWTEMSGQRQDTMDRRIGEVAQDLGSVRRDVQADLERTHRNLAAEAEVMQQQFEVMQQQFQAMQQRFQNRLQDELGHTKTRVHEQLERCFGQVQSRLANLGADERVQVDKTLEHVRTCTSRLENDIMATEVSYMQSLSHLVVYNSWTTAW
ncbi:unnamed protein product [Tilletia controversa]|nr:unnamed protein product [Tilletia caries]CAD6907147.1 unnamed protein product [Tilletia laevis]CAD6912601.1 unnamed protein product [Tilletia controversa]CAD6927703.1 unnamed protein product [Tilletia controversa]CAD6931058.1 unnamed protein product [Tilletia laevis]